MHRNRIIFFLLLICSAANVIGQVHLTYIGNFKEGDILIPEGPEERIYMGSVYHVIEDNKSIAQAMVYSHVDYMGRLKLLYTDDIHHLLIGQQLISEIALARCNVTSDPPALTMSIQEVKGEQYTADAGSQQGVDTSFVFYIIQKNRTVGTAKVIEVKETSSTLKLESKLYGRVAMAGDSLVPVSHRTSYDLDEFYKKYGPWANADSLEMKVVIEPEEDFMVLASGDTLFGEIKLKRSILKKVLDIDGSYTVNGDEGHSPSDFNFLKQDDKFYVVIKRKWSESNNLTKINGGILVPRIQIGQISLYHRHETINYGGEGVDPISGVYRGPSLRTINQYFFTKGAGEVKEATYENLKKALNDNIVSIQILRKYYKKSESIDDLIMAIQVYNQKFE